ncbi:hypothetical protein [Neobacillus sp. LXY-1]|uniref:hypothetical protein n=1 Tax=Neobacillus sp. LXY-1 TaxID=3379133 RepID=UPI003EE2AACC
MVVVKAVKFDGEEIHFFNHAIYIFEDHARFFLELDLIVSEVVLKKYKKVENLIIEIELEDGRWLNLIMHVKILPGRLPQLNLFCEIDDIEDYCDFVQVKEAESDFPNIEEGITLEDIRKVEMPDEEVNIRVKLPIDQVEWVKGQKKSQLSELVKEFIYQYWEDYNK